MAHGILLARVPPQEVADLLQDVFVAALGRLAELRDPEAFGPWLAAIARNRAMDHYRARREALELPPDLEAPDLTRRTEVQRGPRFSASPGTIPRGTRGSMHQIVRTLRRVTF